MINPNANSKQNLPPTTPQRDLRIFWVGGFLIVIVVVVSLWWDRHRPGVNGNAPFSSGKPLQQESTTTDNTGTSPKLAANIKEKTKLNTIQPQANGDNSEENQSPNPQPATTELPKPQKPVTPIATTELENPQPGSNLKYPPKYTYTDETETIGYQDNGKTVDSIEEYDKNTGKEIKRTFHQSDGKTVSSIEEFNKDTGNRTKGTFYQSDGKTVDCIDEYDKDTGKFIKSTDYYYDGKTIASIEEYNKDTDNPIKI